MLHYYTRLDSHQNKERLETNEVVGIAGRERSYDVITEQKIEKHARE